MRFKWRKWNMVLHRDLGYFFCAMTLIYALSGIALNHLKDWDPSYSVSTREVSWEIASPADPLSEAAVLEFLDRYGEKGNYKKHYRPDPGTLKVFLEGGSVRLDLATGKGVIEKLKRRPVLYQVNFLHYNPSRLWTWFSDVYAGALMIIAVTGLFVLKGKKGITGRGAWLAGAGALLPLIFLLLRL